MVLDGPVRFVPAMVVLSWIWVCTGSSPEPAPSPLDATPLAEHLDRVLAWDCAGPRDTLQISRDGTFSWVAALDDGAWTRVDGTWTLAASSGIGARLDIEGVRASKDSGADRPEETDWSGTVHLAPIRALPKAGVVRELDRWRDACVHRLEPAALYDAAVGVDAVAMRGDLEGVFHP
ncbi:MAG: hypothetical protein ACI8PZ_006242 [Myxococcota bacterium]